MAGGKRIVFSTVTPNDQGGIIPNDAIDFSRYSKYPVILCQHQWESLPIGLMTDIRMQGGKWTGVPVFHGETEESKVYKALYESDEGWVRACSIGGEAIWKSNIRKTSYGEVEDFILDDEGNRTCEKFNLYEVSMVTLPSNPDAVALSSAEIEKLNAVKIYEKNILNSISTSITKLSSNLNKMTPEEIAAKAAADKLLADKEAEKTALAAKPQTEKDKKIGLGAKIIQAVGTWLAGASVDDILDETPTAKAPIAPGSELPKEAIKNPTVPQPTPIGLTAKDKAKEKADEAKKKAADAIEKAKEMKDKAETESATEEMKAAYKSACEEMESCMNEAKNLSEKYDAMDDENEDETMSAKKPAITKNAAVKPALKLKTMEELQADAVKIKPAPQAKVIGLASKDAKISKFAADFNSGKDTEGAKVMGRLFSNGSEEKTIADYAILGAAMMNDPKFKAVVEKVRFHIGKESGGAHFGNPQMQGGLQLQNIVAKLASGYCDMTTSYGHTERRNSLTKLTATDTFLASPDLFAIEFLSLAIFALFPATSWKNDIPIFGAQMSADNTGFIWANIAAAPTIYKGTQPVTPAKYTYTDTAVAMQPTPYWLQPMLWTPLTMHQLRYDQMATGWAQAFAAMGAYIDDELIYTLASIVPAASVVTSTGLVGSGLVGGAPATPSTFILNGTAANPNAFIWNAAYNGTLNAPCLQDIITLEQIYSKQNFDLSQQKPTLVVDSTAEAFLAKDPYTLSQLTRWVNADGGEFSKFKNTILPSRSRVAVYDVATGLVKDPYGSIPATSVGANLSFIPSQVGIGLAMLDVFMQQDPVNYGFVMSADTRVGINALRANFNGIALYTYGVPPAPPA